MERVDLNKKFGGVMPEKSHDGMKEVKKAMEKIAGCMSKRAWRAVVWLLVGQFIQVVANVLAVNMYVRRPVLFCVAAGFLVTSAIVLGMLVGRE